MYILQQNSPLVKFILHKLLIVLKKSVPNYCPNHFFAYLKDKKIHIETLNGDKKDVLNVAALSFSEEEENTLTEGIYINGKEMYTAFIEDFTS